jgi:hypothetical protein
MRRPIAVLLVLCAAAAGTMALGSALAARSTAAKSPLAGLDRTFRALQPAARCAAGADKAATARRLRAAALKNAAKAPPKVLKRKKASMRRAIRLLRQAGDLCKAASPPPGTPAPGGTPPPGTPGPGPAPVPPVTTTISLSASAIAPFSPSSATAPAGAIRLQLTNLSATFTHSVGVRTPPPPPHTVLGGPSVPAGPGGSTSLDVTLAAGTYQIYCGVGTHAASGMVIPLTVTP